MTSEQLTSYLKNYQDLGHDELLEISDLQKKYPWFSPLHSLEAKCFKNENRFGLKKAVKKASLFVGNREVLYALIHDQWNSGVPAAEPVQIDSKPVELETNNDVTPAIESYEEINDEVPNTEEQTEKHIPEPEVTKEVVTETTEEPNPEEVNINKKLVESTEIKPEEAEITLDVSEPADTEIKEKEEEVTDSDHSVTKDPQIVYDPLIELQDLVSDDSPTVTDKPEKRPIKTYDPLVELPKLEKKKAQKPGKKDFYSWLDSLGEDEPAETPEKKPRKLQMTAEASKLLEEFIKNRPTISKIRKDVDRLDVYNPVRQSPENEIVSESLAELLLKQEKPEKALEIYEKLRLQNPEKMTYFAALIEKIKKDHNLE